MKNEPLGPKEHIESTFALQKTQRAPVGFWYHFLPDAETGDGLKDGSFLERSVNAHSAFIRDFKPDMVKIMSDGYFFYPTLEPILELNKLEAIITIDSEHPWISLQVALVKKIKELFPDLPYFYNIFSPSTTLKFMLGKNKLNSFLKEDPQRVARALTRMAKAQMVLAEKVIEAQIDGIYLSVQNPSLEDFDKDFYQNFIAPAELMILTAANKAGGKNILHICGYGGVRNRLADFANYEAQAISWAKNVEGNSFHEMREIFGKKAFIGGFPNTKDSVLHIGNRKEIESFTDKILDEAGNLEGIIVGADCTVPSDTGLERLNWVRERCVQRGWIN
ncbi:MAG: uroporphyrinogen decarboxylase [Deltaproteobacteria bacterium]|jgi:uroporphyrinogen decarboxylase|nr:uroporphyrinogen decarboxylase [Deltaproteobacteria bacterium]